MPEKRIFAMVSIIHKKGKGSILPTCPKSFTLENEPFSKEIMTEPARCKLLYKLSVKHFSAASEGADLGTSLNGNEMGKISHVNSTAILQCLCVSSCDLFADNL